MLTTETAERIVTHICDTASHPEFRRLMVDYLGIGSDLPSEHGLGSVELETIDWNPSLARLAVNHGGKWPWPGSDTHAERFRILSREQARRAVSVGGRTDAHGRIVPGVEHRQVRCFFRTMVYHANAQWLKGNLLYFNSHICGRDRVGATWRSAISGRPLPGIVGETISLYARLSLVRRYEWLVTMRTAHGATVEFPATSAGAREAFRFRDLPFGKSRRDALLHWVQHHWRRAPDGDDRAFVRAHLRGRIQFRWHDIECELIPSAYDREREIERKANPKRARRCEL